ncbi:uncharacterized protein LOC115693563 [Syzygium oleosum]|uniref:uncharacterized protein LOC115693563 n=1 Tax=Syzygium oleosum TaxID=219896 RepID=UPI0024BA20BE|nr:uncharacterized protein LOC115693563 [Syzygium oleosum]
MGNRRFTQFPMRDDEEDEPHPRKRVSCSSKNPMESEAESKSKRRTLVKLVDEDRDGGETEEEEEEEADEDVKPIGESVRSSGKGTKWRSHYKAFEYDGNQYELEDTVLLVPEDKHEKPYVAIIKVCIKEFYRYCVRFNLQVFVDIAQTTTRCTMVTVQWFYRPEEAKKKGGGSWQSRDIRELFYSFHRDEVPADLVMHKCVVHYIPIHKQLPHRKQNPGFIVQQVYDTFKKKLWKLIDKDYKDKKQREIDLLLQKTFQRLGDLPDIDIADAHTN